MTRRFKEVVSTAKIIDTETEKEYDGLIDDELLELINDIAIEEDNFGSMLYSLEVLLMDPMYGLLVNTLKENFYEKYKDFDLIEAWDCFVDEINRINTILELHDVLVDVDKECVKKINKRIKEG